MFGSGFGLTKDGSHEAWIRPAHGPRMAQALYKATMTQLRAIRLGQAHFRPYLAAQAQGLFPCLLGFQNSNSTAATT
ncbi:hypothetical protein V6N11_022485 [Hibiscus sabdariffa]|uniref:Uncharacterized protein n=1 Tax=Hibiscus sabdariffa TaxID=183260 RepID=A0ABR2TJY5_9ROSI